MKSKNRSILVTGAKGQLGSEIQDLSASVPSDFEFTDIEELDITSMDDIREFVSSQTFDTVINCAAYTAVDQAEKEEDQAELINKKAAQNIAVMCCEQKARLIHMSTDFVFDGTSHTPYKETDKPHPVSVYGQTKWAGENAVLKHGDDVVIVRTSWLYSSYGHNFVKTMLRLTQERESLNVVFDQVGNPTYARDLAGAVLKIAHAEKFTTGIYHFSNEGVASWYDLAQAIVDITGADCQIHPIETYQYPTPAKRPPYSVLNKAKIKNTYHLQIPHWRESLQKCLSLL
ncbi:MAG: dTDP-4-dehydrorhamnose reductase [Candidatus Aminicenantes bacterium]|nr:dTDP-4-dehydrorhamnose reductase [Candidatus Aminicenantes bacterium]